MDDILLNKLKSKDREIWEKAFVEAKRDRKINELLEVLTDNDSVVSTNSAKVLSELCDARSVKPMIDHALRYRSRGGYKNNPNAPYDEKFAAEDWIKPLKLLVKCCINNIALEELNLLAGLKDLEYSISVEYNSSSYGEGYDDYNIKISFSEVRDVANAELKRRAQKP